MNNVSIENMTNYLVEELLGREPIRTDFKEIFEFIHDKVVLVTDSGVSIGSELCRQVSARDPKQFLIFDMYENNAHDIQNKLKTTYAEQ